MYPKVRASCLFSIIFRLHRHRQMYVDASNGFYVKIITRRQFIMRARQCPMRKKKNQINSPSHVDKQYVTIVIDLSSIYQSVPFGNYTAYSQHNTSISQVQKSINLLPHEAIHIHIRECNMRFISLFKHVYDIKTTLPAQFSLIYLFNPTNISQNKAIIANFILI